MIRIRKAADRGTSDFGWLDSRHTFSFGDYYDPENSGFRTLRVINDDRVAPGAGFPTHPHRDMEIVTWVLEGAIAHKDSMGNGSVIRAGEVQRMSAGTGITHSEFNHSKKEPLHFLQIWIIPNQRGLEPSYEQKPVDRAALSNALVEIPITIHQDAKILATVLERGKEVSHAPAPGRSAWVHVANGSISLNGKTLKEGDGAAVSGEKLLTLEGADKSSEVLVFDLG